MENGKERVVSWTISRPDNYMCVSTARVDDHLVAVNAFHSVGQAQPTNLFHVVSHQPKNKFVSPIPYIVGARGYPTFT